MSLIQKPKTEAMVVANRENSRKSTGPRTELGKRRSRGNAAKHLVFAKVVPDRIEELGENSARFKNLHRSMEEAFEPQDGFARALVEDIVQIRWRLARLRRAEAGILAAQSQEFRLNREMESVKVSAGVGWRESVSMFQRRTFGFGGAADSSYDCRFVLGLLLVIRNEAKLGIFKEDSVGVLRGNFGKGDLSMRPSLLIRQYERCCGHPTSGRSEDQEQERREVVELLDDQIKHFEKLARLFLQKECEVYPCEDDAQLLPKQEDLDRVIRYESHLERLLERKLQQLVAWRRVKAEGSESKEGADQKWDKGEDSLRKVS